MWAPLSRPLSHGPGRRATRPLCPPPCPLRRWTGSGHCCHRALEAKPEMPLHPGFCEAVGSGGSRTHAGEQQGQGRRPAGVTCGSRSWLPAGRLLGRCGRAAHACWGPGVKTRHSGPRGARRRGKTNSGMCGFKKGPACRGATPVQWWLTVTSGPNRLWSPWSAWTGRSQALVKGVGFGD